MRKKFLSGFFAVIAVLMIGSIALSCKNGGSSKPKATYTGIIIKLDGVDKTGLTVNGVQGDTLTFTAEVLGKNNPKQDVTWSMTGNNAGTTLSNGGVLSIAADEIADVIRVTAISNVQINISAFVDVNVLDATKPRVDSITVTADAAEVALGGTLQFYADVSAFLGASEEVTWSIASEYESEETVIDEDGLLTVGEDETALSITVKANSTEPDFENIEGTLTVGVYDPNVPRIVSVTVTSDDDIVAIGETMQFTAVVAAENGINEDIIWSIEGSATLSLNTGIDVDGLLTVGSDETPGITITVTATPVEEDFEDLAGSKTVMVYDPTLPEVISVTVTADAETAAWGSTLNFYANVVAVGGASSEVFWEITSSYTSAATGIDVDGILTIGADETALSITVKATPLQEDSEDKADTKTITLFNPNPPTVLSVVLNSPAEEVVAGDSLLFSATVTVENGASEDVTWTITSTVNSANTKIDATGLLTVGADETVTSITVRATPVETGFASLAASKTVDVLLPAVTNVTINTTGNATTIITGQSLQFTATVTVEYGASQDVTWSLDGGPYVSGTGINASGLLTVAAAETATSITVKATPVQPGFASLAETKTIDVLFPAVTGVTVDALDDEVALGGNVSFIAFVTVTNGASQSVTWTIESGHATGTTINTSGVLTVAANETEATLTIKATPVQPGFAHLASTKTITVLLPSVNGVTVTSPVNQVALGGNVKFSAEVDTENGASQDVTWSLDNGPYASGTNIDATGLLTVASNETAATITVRATSDQSSAIYGTKAITVLLPTVTGVTITTAGSATTIIASKTLQFYAAVAVTNGASQDVTWSLDGTYAAGTGINATSGLLTVAASETAASITVKATPVQAGFAALAETKTVTVLIPTVTNISVTSGGNTIALGTTMQFSATVTVINEASQGVTWSIDETHLPGTTISTTGLLTVAANETAAILTVRATSVQYGFTSLSDAKAVTVLLPKVNGITVNSAANATSVIAGKTLSFTASVDAVNGAGSGVTWSIPSTHNGETTIDASGLLTVAPGETAATLTIRATSTAAGFTGVYGERTVSVLIPTVTNINVTSGGNTIALGATMQFYAAVTVTNEASQGVVWSVDTPHTGGTSVSASGLLTVAANETAATLTVRATSDQYGYTSVSGAKTVTVLLPKVNSVIVSAAGGANSITAGGASLQINVAVDAENGAASTVTWSLVGSYVTGTSISNTGLLTVAALETASSITVRAASTQTGYTNITDDITLTVLKPTVTNVTVTSPGNTSVIAGQQLQFISNVTATNGASTGVTWSISSTHDTGTTITGGLLTVAALEPATSITVRATSDQPGFTTVYGEMTVTVNKPGVTSITVNSAGGAVNVKQGQTLLFSADVVVTYGATQSVTWSLDGGPYAAGTGINATSGLLTVAAAVPAGTTITVRATTQQAGSTTYGTMSVTVLDASVMYQIYSNGVLNPDFVSGFWDVTPVMNSTAGGGGYNGNARSIQVPVGTGQWGYGFGINALGTIDWSQVDGVSLWVHASAPMTVTHFGFLDDAGGEIKDTYFVEYIGDNGNGITVGTGWQHIIVPLPRAGVVPGVQQQVFKVWCPNTATATLYIDEIALIKAQSRSVSLVIADTATISPSVTVTGSSLAGTIKVKYNLDGFETYLIHNTSYKAAANWFGTAASVTYAVNGDASLANGGQSIASDATIGGSFTFKVTFTGGIESNLMNVTITIPASPIIEDLSAPISSYTFENATWWSGFDAATGGRNSLQHSGDNNTRGIYRNNFGQDFSRNIAPYNTANAKVRIGLHIETTAALPYAITFSLDTGAHGSATTFTNRYNTTISVTTGNAYVDYDIPLSNFILTGNSTTLANAGDLIITGWRVNSTQAGIYHIRISGIQVVDY